MSGKNCTKCDAWKDLNDFPNNKVGIGGKSSHCKDCAKSVYREHYHNNKEKAALNKQKFEKENKEYLTNYRKEYYVKNKDKFTVRSKKYNKENKEKVNEATKNWIKNNPEKRKLQKIKRRTLEKQLPSTLTPEEWNHTLTYFNHSCALTGHKKDLHRDHVIPLSSGYVGTVYGNLIPLRADINISKRDSNIFEWYETNKDYFDISEDKFIRLIDFLASTNNMNLDDYKMFVYRCHNQNVNELT